MYLRKFTETYSQKELAKLIGTNENNLSSLLVGYVIRNLLYYLIEGMIRVNRIVPSARKKIL